MTLARLANTHDQPTRALPAGCAACCWGSRALLSTAWWYDLTALVAAVVGVVAVAVVVGHLQTSSAAGIRMQELGLQGKYNKRAGTTPCLSI